MSVKNSDTWWCTFYDIPLPTCTYHLFLKYLKGNSCIPFIGRSSHEQLYEDWTYYSHKCPKPCHNDNWKGFSVYHLDRLTGNYHVIDLFIELVNDIEGEELSEKDLVTSFNDQIGTKIVQNPFGNNLKIFRKTGTFVKVFSFRSALLKYSGALYFFYNILQFICC